MHRGIYEKRKKLIIWATVLNFVIVLPIVILPALGKARGNSKFSREKARLQQIAFTVALYYTDGGLTTYPKSPSQFDFDTYILNNAIQDSWFTLSNSSPFYFFPCDKSTYTGSPWKPLAVRKIPINIDRPCIIVFEDGRVRDIAPELARFLIFCSRVYKALVFKEGFIQNDL